ncbi:molybdopterin molybdotransferase MoeA [Streptomyces sp. NPDC050504]|uniref:molybdopterin molybdotransferase MoeA n=1 Tax=Streptomyces sp. NPDC050504 TaxID=3365618 RepID=UPI00379347C9
MTPEREEGRDRERELDGVEEALALVSRAAADSARPRRTSPSAPAPSTPYTGSTPSAPPSGTAAPTGPPAPRPGTGRHRATPWAEARETAARAGRGAPARTHRTPLADALGRTLAEPLDALTDLPPFDTSAMDGWAASGPGPWTVREGAGVLAGSAAPGRLADGDAVRIATGARIPPDATAVIRSEHARVTPAHSTRDAAEEPRSAPQLYAEREVVHGQDIRPRAQECRTGDRLLAAGSLVTPAVLGLAAAAGYDELPTVPRPRAEVLVLGDELLAAGLPHDGLIRDALGPLLGPWLRALGADVARVRRVGDDADELLRAVTQSEAELVVTTGGTAAGPVDHVHPVLTAVGAELLVDGVKVRPGHPMLLARLSPGRHLVGLPGNPLAAVSGLLTLAGPLVRALARHAAPREPYTLAVRDEVHGHPHDTRLVPVEVRAGRLLPLHYNGPAMLRGIAAADGLAVVPPGGARPGDELEVLRLPWTEACFT